MRLDWLPGVLRGAGLEVYEDPGWLQRETRPGFDPQGLVWHHTATSKSWQDGHVLALLRAGRRDLSGPLSQAGLERDGTWVLVAGGRANHNGYGLWGNDSIGVEAYNDGIGEPWPEAQLQSYEIGSAAICDHLGWDPMEKVKGHRETDPGRKIDPTGIDMDGARALVARLIEEDDMFTDADRALLKRLDERETKRNAQVQERLDEVLAILGDDNTERTVQARLKETLIKVREIREAVTAGP